MKLFIDTLYSIYLLLIVVAPVSLGYWFFHVWVRYVRMDFLSKQEHILLEFRLPKEITKSPLAMEVFFNALYQTGSESTWFDKYWKGGMRPWFSLELVSIEGQVHFYIWTRKGFKKNIESQLYSQYPDVEIAEVPDYTEGVTFDPQKNAMYGCYFYKSKPSFYPILTYIDFGLDRDPKEELKIDPMTPLVEFLGSIESGEQVWLQIIIRAHKKETTKPGTWKEKVDWKYFAAQEVAKKMKRNKSEGETADRLTKREKDVIEAVENTVSKYAFDVGIRGIYLADIKDFKGGNIPGLRGMFRQFGSDELNQIKPSDSTSFDFPWEDIFDIRLNHKKRQILSYYKKRAYFRPAYHIGLVDQFLQQRYSVKYSTFNVEELASIYHFPGKVSRTPTVSRLNSKKADAPSNLPI